MEYFKIELLVTDMEGQKQKLAGTLSVVETEEDNKICTACEG